MKKRYVWNIQENPVNPSITPIDTLLKHSDEEAEVVTVADPTHPLYGKSFRVAYYKGAASEHIFVHARSAVLLYLPRTAIQPPPTGSIRTKLNLQSISALVEQAKVFHLCESNPPNSGADSPSQNNNTSFNK